MKRLLIKTKSFLKRIKTRLKLNGRQEQTIAFEVVFKSFQNALALNNRILALFADIGNKLSGDYIFDKHYIQSSCRQLADMVYDLVDHLNLIAPSKYAELYEVFRKINHIINEELAGRPYIPRADLTLPYQQMNKDNADIAGAKNANLAEIKNNLGLPIPEGFAITSGGFAAFMTHNHLWGKVHAIVDEWHDQAKSVEHAATQIQDLIQQGEIPPVLKKSILSALQQFSGDSGERERLFALRSSAWGEDGEASFAGQYKSLLNQKKNDIVDGYKKIVASLYSSQAMEYRLQKGFSESEVVMTVGCQVMINAKTGGILYTFNPLSPDSKCMLAAAVWGLGSRLADGHTDADLYLINRSRPYTCTMELTPKLEKLITDDQGETKAVPVLKADQNISCLGEHHLKQLAEAGMTIEKHFKTPQDIEFAIDQDDNLIILQARPLNIKSNRSLIARQLPETLEKYEVLLNNHGTIAQNGIGIGNVFIVQTDGDLESFPRGAILVSKFTSPRFVKVIDKANGIITDVGSATGHMATIAREFGVPAIVNTKVATQTLKHGQAITLDADENKVYSGIIEELRDYHLTEYPIDNTYEYRLLRRILKKVGRLTLLDPASNNFKPSGCRTFHDITRFVHEKLVEELINKQYYQSHRHNMNTVKLKISVPLNMTIIDIGGGILHPKKRSSIRAEAITSVPMAAFVEGLTMPGAWNIKPMPVDFGSFMSSMTRTIPTGLSSPQEIGQNLAVLSKAYAHISLRLGYHFTMIDSYIDENENSNYAYFRFAGGVTDETRRSRRAQLLSDILTQNDFRVEIKSDLVIARLKKSDSEMMKQKLFVLGVLVAFSRQLDVQMSSDQQVHLYTEHFKTLMTSNDNLYNQREKLE